MSNSINVFLDTIGAFYLPKSLEGHLISDLYQKKYDREVEFCTDFIEAPEGRKILDLYVKFLNLTEAKTKEYSHSVLYERMLDDICVILEHREFLKFNIRPFMSSEWSGWTVSIQKSSSVTDDNGFYTPTNGALLKSATEALKDYCRRNGQEYHGYDDHDFNKNNKKDQVERYLVVDQYYNTYDLVAVKHYGNGGNDVTSVNIYNPNVKQV